MRAFLLVACSVLLPGCFIEAAGGMYDAIMPHESQLVYGLGVEAGIYIDPGDYRLQLGGGAELAFVDTPGPGDSVHSAAGLYARSDIGLAHLGDLGPLTGMNFRVTAAYAVGSGVRHRTSDTQSYDNVPGSWGMMGFVGGSFHVYWGEYSLTTSTGPALLYTQSTMVGDMYAVGAQLRLTFTWAHPNFAAFTGNGTTSEEFNAENDRARQENEREGERLQQNMDDEQRQNNRDHCLQGDNYCHY